MYLTMVFNFSIAHIVYIYYFLSNISSSQWILYQSINILTMICLYSTFFMRDGEVKRNKNRLQNYSMHSANVGVD